MRASRTLAVCFVCLVGIATANAIRLFGSIIVIIYLLIPTDTLCIVSTAHRCIGAVLSPLGLRVLISFFFVFILPLESILLGNNLILSLCFAIILPIVDSEG